VAEEFLEHANEEQAHADLIAERITQLGASRTSTRRLLTRSHFEYIEGDDLVDMIKEDLVAERIAIDSYSEMIRYIAEGRSYHRRMLEGILATEEEHARISGCSSRRSAGMSAQGEREITPCSAASRRCSTIPILATDGEIGHVTDILLSDSDLRLAIWSIDTGGWLSGRKVLLSHGWLSSVAPEKRMIVVNIEKKRIKESPPYDPDAAIPREYETRLHDYYGWPYYWQP